jgi:hypothetical protein
MYGMDINDISVFGSENVYFMNVMAKTEDGGLVQAVKTNIFPE